MSRISFVCYHYLKRNDEFKMIKGHTLNQFQQHLDYFRENFNFADVQGGFKDLKKDEKTSLVITFDDGLKEHAVSFAPLLQKYSIKAVFSVPGCILRGEPANPQIIRLAQTYFGDQQFYNFVRSEIKATASESSSLLLEQTDRLDGNSFEKHIKELFKWKLEITLARQILLNLYNKYLLPKFPDLMSRTYLDRKDIVRLRSAGHTIGVHSDTHPVISRIKTEDERLFHEQIVRPKKELEKLLGEEVNVFTYPHGQKEEILDDVLSMKKAGYKLVFTTFREGSKFNPLTIGRYQSHVADTIETLPKNMWSYTL